MDLAHTNPNSAISISSTSAMDSYEATRIVFARIQNLDPENASRIMGLLLIQDHGEKEMIRLAFGPEAFLHSVILKARKELGVPISNSPSTPSTPSSPSPFLSTNPITISRQTLLPQNNLIMSPSSNLALNGSSSSSSMMNSSLPFYGNGGTDVIDEFQLQEQLSFLNDGSPALGPKSPDFFYPQTDLSSSPTNGSDPALFSAYHGSANWGGGGGGPLHRRSCSVSDVCSEDPNSAGFGWKPCLYFARGYCKNGTSCRFLHGGGLGDSVVDGGGQMAVGSPSKLEMLDQSCHEALLRSKTAQQQQQRLAAASQLMASANSFPYSSKCMNFLLQQQQTDAQRAAAAAALMMGDDMHKFSRSRLERTDFSMNGGGAGMVNPASRQIYLTFPADSTFREEDVSNYFSIYGPVQDVRIPYQQKRMFGFVTFVYPETVKLILAKGNPHFVCDARVLVKPYKEKGKVQDKKQQQQVDRGDLSPCGTPTGLDSRDPYDIQLGARMFYNPQDMLWRRKLEEQAELQQALEIQSRRLMGLQLLDVKKHHHRSLSSSSPIQSPTQSPSMFNQNLMFPSIPNGPEVPQENSTPMPPTASEVDDDQLLKEAAHVVLGKEVMANNDEKGSGSGSGNANANGEESPRDNVNNLLESLEHNLPDSPFASPTKGAGEYTSSFPSGTTEANDSDASAANMNLATSLLPAASTLDMASFKSFNCQIPRLSSGHGTIGGMYGGTGAGPKCPEDQEVKLINQTKPTKNL
ncbi:zinc finger CCCH-type family protein / RNA recognition motif-containing protein [Prunus dulcis]|uniref:Zinc finger CCCH-type family protein / RNA recognition motif-containing protein n=1 Tax=Prunus dulcis TaxID=3755 RepID=A0A4Y1QX71_PRUDU|nr:zinc finger CCCH-type family protein / RNA recognition motif-containing protein [Prunus dulcis]